MATRRTEIMTDRNSWMTPNCIFEPLHQKYNFTVDACAEQWNTKLPRFWSPEQDGLAQTWEGERIWCNPPYGRGLIQPWIDKALSTKHSLDITFLLPSRTDSPWFQKLWMAQPQVRSSVYFLPKRVHFVPPPGITASSPTEASIIVRCWS